MTHGEHKGLGLLSRNPQPATGSVSGMGEVILLQMFFCALVS